MDNFECIERMMTLCEMVNSSVESPTDTIDPAHYKAYVKSPGEIDSGIMQELAEVVDVAHDSKNVIAAQQAMGRMPAATPSALDQLMNSILVVYITCDDYPVAVTCITDPSVEDYHGFVPLSFYSMKTGYSLDGRLQQPFMSINEDYRSVGLARELFLQLNAHGTPCFIVVDPTDAPTVKNVQECGYMKVGNMVIDESGDEMELWVSPVKEDENVADE